MNTPDKDEMGHEWSDEEIQREMYEAASILSQDAEVCRVEYAFAAQAEVVLADDRIQTSPTAA